MNLTISVNKPDIKVWRGFLTPSECEEIIEAARPRLSPSYVMDANGTGIVLDPVRTSHGSYFSRDQFPLLGEINRRAAEITKRDSSTFETLSVLRYEPGQEYKPHWDYFHSCFPQSAPQLLRGGQRTGTMLIYLKTPEEGGETVFPDAGIAVSAIAGDALYFGYPTPTQDTLTLHGGSPVIRGEKWVATIWMREKEFI